MEKHPGKQHVAIVEPCVMAGVGLRHLLSSSARSTYAFHFFHSIDELRQSMSAIEYFAVICCLSDIRELRLESLLFQDEIANSRPVTLRIILGGNAKEVELIKQLSPTLVNGVLSKTESLPCLKSMIMDLLKNGGAGQPVQEENVITVHHRYLSPTERAILRYMTCGYSLTDIATRLERNIKTIRAHKFNAMAKLGVNSDIGLLSAADLLMSLPDRYGLSNDTHYAQ
ncbi:DNA-binding transcriptional activator BglJ [Pseudocitrobacter cyperus]|uniref:DNA-binding transcriptional activator BglJ n=1 Tax=Pseudocitrobacter cyperus TaxID=3112843 RepID=A0ABV0HQM4_9ENTR